MAARRGKTQARRNQDNSGLPGWAWGVLGLVLGIGLILAAPKFMKSGGDGFFRPQPNPDAQPVPVAIDEDEVVAPQADGAPRDPAKTGDKPAPAAGKSTEYDFYTLLPGKEVPMTEAELAATERAEAQRRAQQHKQAQAATTAVDGAASPVATAPLPAAVATGGEAAKPAATATPIAAATASTQPAAATAGDTTRYLLQAGAFEASGQAEELKAKIAMLGLGARVESAAIGGKTVYRVRMGPYGSASELAEAKRKLAGSGLPGMPIKVR